MALLFLFYPKTLLALPFGQVKKLLIEFARLFIPATAPKDFRTGRKNSISGLSYD